MPNPVRRAHRRARRREAGQSRAHDTPQRLPHDHLSSFRHVHYACCARPQLRSCLLPGERLGIHIPHTSSPQEKRPHSGIGFHTPADVHYGRAELIRADRGLVLDAAYAAHPERFVRKPPTPPALPTAAWINRPDEEPTKQYFFEEVVS